MKKIFAILFFALVALGATSCQESYLWGETKYYKDFLWCKYTPVEMTQTIEFGLNSDGEKFFDSNKAYIKFKVVGKDGKTPKHIDITFNGERCDDYTFVVRPNGESVSGRLGVIFHNDAPKGKYEYLIRYVDNRHISKVEIDGRDVYVGNYELEVGKNIWGFGLDDSNPICVKKRDVTNPLLVGLIAGLVSFLAIVILWLVARRFIYPPIKLNSISFEGPDDFNGIFTFNKCHRMIFTNQNKRQGFFNWLFKGKTKYIYGAVWDSEIEIKQSLSNTVIYTRGGWYCDQYVLYAGSDFSIENGETNERGNICTQ